VIYSSNIQSPATKRLIINPDQNPKQREQLKSSLNASYLKDKKFLKSLKILPYFKINIKPRLARR
jgi:hypothetical protein